MAPNAFFPTQLSALVNPAQVKPKLTCQFSQIHKNTDIYRNGTKLSLNGFTDIRKYANFVTIATDVIAESKYHS